MYTHTHTCKTQRSPAFHFVWRTTSCIKEDSKSISIQYRQRSLAPDRRWVLCDSVSLCSPGCHWSYYIAQGGLSLNLLSSCLSLPRAVITCLYHHAQPGICGSWDMAYTVWCVYAVTHLDKNRVHKLRYSHRSIRSPTNYKPLTVQLPPEREVDRQMTQKEVCLSLNVLLSFELSAMAFSTCSKTSNLKPSVSEKE